MAVKAFLSTMSLAALSDGYVGRVIDQGLDKISEDLLDRDDGKTRKLVITLTFKPCEHDRIAINAEVTVKLPNHQPPVTIAKLDRQSQGVYFNPNLADNPDQSTIVDDDEK